MTKNIFETHLTNKLWKQKYQGKIHNLKKKWKTKLIMHIMGHKNEPYYKTEKEMLEDKIYNYESLSEDEKKIYNKKYERSI
tara:strand:+ start:207 stop:449 length:243 start_codon:yes stop_codon:yes gene_type:complete